MQHCFFGGKFFNRPPGDESLKLKDGVLRLNLCRMCGALGFDAKQARDETRQMRRGGDEQFRFLLRASKVRAARDEVSYQCLMERCIFTF